MEWPSGDAGANLTAVQPMPHPAPNASINGIYVYRLLHFPNSLVTLVLSRMFEGNPFRSTQSPEASSILPVLVNIAIIIVVIVAGPV